MTKITPPNPKFFDRAIKRLMTGKNLYSCIALTASINGNATPAAFTRYRVQYEKWVRSQNNGRLPYWWNSWKDYKWQRVAALLGFKQACIDAAKKTKKGK